MRARLQSRVFSNIPGLLPATLGAITLAWVGQSAWHDITFWGKDLTLIFFGSRIGENISLGIGMKVIHYFLIGLTLILLGSITTLRRRNMAQNPLINHSTKQIEKEKGVSWCPHDFGYLGSLPDFESVPEECLTCQKVLECRNVPARQSARR